MVLEGVHLHQHASAGVETTIYDIVPEGYFGFLIAGNCTLKNDAGVKTKRRIASR